MYASYEVIEILGWNEYGGWRVGVRDNDNTYHYFAHLAYFNEDIKKATLLDLELSLAMSAILDTERKVLLVNLFLIFTIVYLRTMDRKSGLSIHTPPLDFGKDRAEILAVSNFVEG